jgi:hypothetical protein
VKRLVPTAIAAILAIVATYAVLRGWEVLFSTEPNPATVIYSPRIEMAWRLVIGCYVGAMTGVGAFAASARSFERTMQVLGWAVPIVAALIAVQGILLP